MFAYLNINSIRNKFDDLCLFIQQDLDIVCIAETKIDESFPTSQFLMNGFQKPLRLDVSNRSGGILVYIKNYLKNVHLLKFNLPEDIQAIPFFINLRKIKWLFIAIYKPPSQNSQYFLNNLTAMLEFYSSQYENFIIIGDFNLTQDTTYMKEFIETNNLYNLIKQNTCFKGKGSLLDLILTNKKNSFVNSSTLETGISDFHHMIFSVMKTHWEKEESKQKYYRNFKNFSFDTFKNDLEVVLQINDCKKIEDLNNLFVTALNNHAPKKHVTIRYNNKPHMTKQLRKEIMKRSHLKNKANITKNPSDLVNYKRQRNLVVKLNIANKRKYFSEISQLNSSKPFWELCKPYFTNKGILGNTNIILSENGKNILDKQEIATILNSYFGNIAENLNLPRWPSQSNLPKNDTIGNIILKYKNHPSIIKIKSTNIISKRFVFHEITTTETAKIINDLSCNKKSSGEIPTNLLKISNFIFPYITKSINNAFRNNSFPDCLKLADIIPIHKSDEITEKSNYRPISLLPLLSKIFEKVIYQQLTDYIDKLLSIFLCGFRKGCSTQHALFRLIQAWQEELDNSGFVGTVLMDLSKAYDCLPHDLMIAKLEAYGLHKDSLVFMLSYLKNRKQRTRIGSTVSPWFDIIRGVPQGSILGPLLFNIFINDIFHFSNNCMICNFVDDNTLSYCHKDINQLLKHLTEDTKSLLKWFELNSLKANPKKFQFMILGNIKEKNSIIEIDSIRLESTDCVKLLGIKIDNRLRFHAHINNLVKNANLKLHALRRIRKNLTTKKAKVLCNAFINCQFFYAPLIWMFCRKELYHKIQNIHYKALKVVYKSNESYEHLLTLSNDVSIHQRHLKFLACEIFKSLNGLNPPFMGKYFLLKNNNYNLRKGSSLTLPPARSSYYGVNSINFRANLIWNNLPADAKNSSSILEFKRKLKLLGNIDCSCLICT